MQADLQVKQAELVVSERVEGQKMAFEASEKAKDREQQWNIELLKIQAQREQHQDQMAAQRVTDLPANAKRTVKYRIDGLFAAGSKPVIDLKR